MNPIHLASAAVITGFTTVLALHPWTKLFLPQSRPGELYHTVLWGRDPVTKRLSAYTVRNRSNPSEDCRVPSCAQLKTSAATLPPRSIRMVSPKSCSQVTRQLGGCHVRRCSECIHILRGCRGMLSKAQQKVWSNTLILNKDSWRLFFFFFHEGF